MIIDHPSLRLALARSATAATAALLTCAPVLSSAAQLNLATAPLFVSGTVQPNIFFLLDDSGSMDWATMTPESDGIMTVGGCDYYYAHPAPGVAVSTSPAANTSSEIMPTPEYVKTNLGVADPQGGIWRAWNKDYNGLYYDPSVTYTPWKGKNASNVTYGDASPTAAPYNPYDPSQGTINLTANTTYSARYCPKSTGTYNNITYYPARYYVWTDSNSNGKVDGTDAKVLVEIRSTTPLCSANGNVQPCLVRAYASEIQNFANWFSYYRKRDLTMKKAVSELISSSRDRMGLATLHNNSSVGTQVANVDDITTPVDAANAANKSALMRNLCKVRASGGTPLRTALDNIGRYFEGISQTALFGAAPSHTGTITSLSPILNQASGGECQQNFTIAMTDGFYNDSISSSSSIAVGNTDGDKSTKFDGGAYADTYTNTLADYAMRYYERDLWPSTRTPNLDNKVPTTPGVDENDAQHLVTFTVGFGVNGTLTAGPTDPTKAFAWPNPTSGDAQKIDDLRHAAYNGRGKFLSAKNPTELVSSMQAAVQAIAERTGSAAAVATNARSLNTNTTVYQARFTSGEWSGELRAYPVDGKTGLVGAELWNAASALKGQNWDTGRKIITYSGSAGTPFRWASLTASQQTALNKNPATSISDSQGSARLDYLRGDHSNEGTGNYYRTRKDGFVLGDIVDSAPVYVGVPVALPPLEAVPHSSFRSSNSTRPAMIYVGGNDGMLHAFDVATGAEKLAFVPNKLFSKLNALTDPSYIHGYYVNASAAAGDAYFGGAWHTMLVGGLAAGGKGYYALDVTDPAGFSEGAAASIVKWEFTDSSDADLGYTYGQPTIMKMKNGKWAAIFGNGYNSSSEKPVLYVVDISNGAVIRKIDLSNGTTGNGSGLSEAAVVDQDGDYVADYIYAGDLKGNLWKIDVTASSPGSWGSSYATGSTVKPLFKAVDAGAVAQPITMRPEVSRHPDGQGGFMVYFGTGKYLENGDRVPIASPKHSFYGIWDKNPGSGNLTGTQPAAVVRADLLAQTFTTTTVTDAKTGVTATVRLVTDNTMVWRPGASTPDYLGWREDMPVTGEMIVANPVLIGGEFPRVLYTTLIPESASTCSVGGDSWLMEVSVQNGGLLETQVFDTNGDGVIDQDDVIVAGMHPGVGILPQPAIIQDPAKEQLYKITSGSSGAITTVRNKADVKAQGRQSWRQMR